MSDINPDDLDLVTQDDVQAFIKAKKIRTSCAECGHGIVGLSTERLGKTPSILSFSVKSPQIDQSYINFYWQLVCFNCGHLRMFEKSEVLKWKNQRAEDVSNQS